MITEIYEEIEKFKCWEERFGHIFYNDKFVNKLQIFEDLLKIFEDTISNLNDDVKKECKKSIEYNISSLNWIIFNLRLCKEDKFLYLKKDFKTESEYIKYLKKSVLFFDDNLNSDSSEGVVIYSRIGLQYSWDKLKEFGINEILEKESTLFWEEIREESNKKYDEIMKKVSKNEKV